MKEDKKEEKKVIGGKYTIYLNEELGRGTFAVTYAAKFKNPPHTQFACKMIVKNHIQKLLDVNYVTKRIQDELKSWKMLSHSNIVKFQGCQETKNSIYFFMERCNDGTLQQRIRKNKIQINYLQMIKFSKQLISACTYLEEKSIVHRDIKPQNILLKDNVVKLGDFGLAKIISELQRSTFFTFAGTLQFMAPQIFQQAKNPYKCDIWSVGVTMFLMFTNQLPFNLHFKDNSEHKIKEKISEGQCKLDYKIFEEYPKIKQVISLMLRKNPKERPTMKEINEMLQEVE